MTTIQIIAFLSVLASFGVDPMTVAKIHDILIPPATTTQAFTPAPVTITPVVENQPVYFGSTAPVVELPVMKDVVKEIDAFIPLTMGGQTSEVIEIHYKENGKEVAGVPITITLSQGTFLIPGQVGRDPGAGTRTNTITIPNGEKGILKGYSTGGVKYSAYSSDVGEFLPGAIITITANGLTKTIQGRDIYKLK